MPSGVSLLQKIFAVLKGHRLCCYPLENPCSLHNLCFPSVISALRTVAILHADCFIVAPFYVTHLSHAANLPTHPSILSVFHFHPHAAISPHSSMQPSEPIRWPFSALLPIHLYATSFLSSIHANLIRCSKSSFPFFPQSFHPP